MSLHTIRTGDSFGYANEVFNEALIDSPGSQQEWNTLNLGSKGTTLLRRYFANISIEKIIQNYSFKDTISQKIFSATITKANESLIQDSLGYENQIDELVSKYGDQIQNITDSTKTKEEVAVLDVAKHFPNLMDKRNFQIKQLFWGIVDKAKRSIYYSPLRPRKEANYNETQPFFYLRSFLSPRVIEHLPEATFLDVISEVKCFQFPNSYQSDDRSLCISINPPPSHYTDFTWELVHWLLLVMKHFEEKNNEIVKECTQALNHLCSQTSDALAHYLMIQNLLKSDQVYESAIRGAENLEKIFKNIQGPRDYFPYCLLDQNFLSDSGKN